MTTTEKQTRIRFYQKVSKVLEVFETEVKDSCFNYFEKLAMKTVISALTALKHLGESVA